MMIDNKYLSFALNKEAMLNFLSFFERNGLKNKFDYELHAAIFFTLGLIKQKNKDFRLTIPCREKYYSDLLRLSRADFESSDRGFREMVAFLEKYSEESHHIDFGISLPASRKGQVANNKTFQIKRCGFGENIDDEIVSYLNKNSKIREYSQEGLCLLLRLESDIGDLDGVVDRLQIDDLPFREISFIFIADDFVHIGELYPRRGELFFR